MSHEEIAAALGISGGAARQAIARARAAVRGGLGALVPLPLLRALASGGDAGAEAAIGGAGAAAGGAGVLGGSALKVGLATVVVVGGVGAGAAIDHHGAEHRRSERPRPQAVTPAPARVPVIPRAQRVERTPSPVVADVDGDSHEEAPSAHRHAGHEGHERHERHHHEVEPAVEPEAVAAPTVVDDPAPEPSESGGGPVETFSSESSTSGGPGPSSFFRGRRRLRFPRRAGVR